MRNAAQILPELTYPQDTYETNELNETVAVRKIFYRLGESEIFNYANDNTMVGGMRLVDVIPRMAVPNQGFLHVEYAQLDKTVQYELFEGPHYKLTCKKAMKSLIENGKIQMVYSEQYKIPTCIPYIIQGVGNSCRIFVNISDFVQLDAYGRYQINQPRNFNAPFMAVDIKDFWNRMSGKGWIKVLKLW